MTASKAWIGAIFATIAAGLSALAVVLVGDNTLADLTQGQWLAVITSALFAGGGVYGFVFHTSNAPAAPVGEVEPAIVPTAGPTE